MDAQVGRLLDALEVRGRLERTVIVVVGDHGESLGEHGEDDHGIFIYENVLRVPLIVPGTRHRAAPCRGPGPPARRHADDPRLGLERGRAGSGRCESSATADGQRSDLGLEAYAESEYPERMGWSPLRSLSDGRYKVIDAPRPELYDLQRDPFEAHNIYREQPALGALMTSRVRTLARPPAPALRAAAPPAELTARLAALGYVGTAGPTELAAGKARPDPKDCIGEVNARSRRAVLPAPPGHLLVPLERYRRAKMPA